MSHLRLSRVGGAYVVGSAQAYTHFVGQIATRAKVAAFVPDYGLAPERPFPAAASPFHQQLDSRSDKFWMTSHPWAIDDGRVTALLGHWGGESVYFWLPQDSALRELVGNTGIPRVLEIAVPLDATNRASWAGEAVVRTFGRTLGCKPDFEAFDLYLIQALGPESVRGP